jgi:hypothetical protein
MLSISIRRLVNSAAWFFRGGKMIWNRVLRREKSGMDDPDD